MTLIGAAASRSRITVVSPLVDFVAFAVTRPVAVTRRASKDSPRPADGTARTTGTAEVPITCRSAAAGRTPSWPYGAASLPLPSTPLPLASVGAPSGRWTTSPASGDPIASSAGVPRRPASATTTPVVRTFDPIGIALTDARDEGPIVGDGDAVGVGTGEGIGVGEAVDAVVGVAVGPVVGVGLGVGEAVGVGSAVAVGVGTGVGTGVAVGVGVAGG